MSVAVTLSIPGLLNPLRMKEAHEALKTLELPALQKMLSKADRFSSKDQTPYEQSNYLFHQSKPQALASVMAAAELENFDDSCFWLRIDPVQMIADRDSLVLIPGADLGMTEDESKALLKAFNEHFVDDRVCLEYGSTNNWYLRIVQPIDLQTHTLDSVAYQPVGECYPTGNAADYWRKMINETQMLFYSHPVNEARRSQQLPEINSIWAWGEGQLNLSLIVERQNAMVWSDFLYLQGLTKLTKSKLAASPVSHTAWQQVFSEQISSDDTEIGHHLIHLDPIVNALDNMQESEWISALQLLESDWFESLVQAVKNREITSLLLDFGNGCRYHLEPSHLNRFWRLNKSLIKI